MRSIFVLTPSPHPTGPVKGALALANALAPTRRVVLVFLKPGPGVNAPLDERVEVVSLAQVQGGWRGKLNAYRKLLRAAGRREEVGSISMCLSADWINRFCRHSAVTCASVRGNLLQNYRLDYGLPGIGLAIAHLLSLRAFDCVVAMTNAMADQIRSLTAMQTHIIGNFVDEAALECYRQSKIRSDGPLHFVFVGSLSQRKQPELLLQAVEKLENYDVQLHIIGDGPLRREMELSIANRELQHKVRLHGHLANPYSVVANADVFVLPSRSEGMSRAALEALYLGTPCVLRDVDGNAELLNTPDRGEVFTQDEDLANTMLKTALHSRTRTSRECLLPPSSRQLASASSYVALLEEKA